MSSGTQKHQNLQVSPSPSLTGTTTVAGDKSISHRAIILGALADGSSEIDGWLASGDTLATLHAVQQLGVQIEAADSTIRIHGGRLHQPSGSLDLVNAGTGFRLLAGVLAAQPFPSVLDGSNQLRRRPMRRITDPLAAMGARITSSNGFPPLHFEPASLTAIHYQIPVASAQVKSAILLAGLFTTGQTTIIQPGPARDHTERMLTAMGADLHVNYNTVTLTPGAPLQPLQMTIPGDFSSAAFLLVAACITPDSQITIDNVSINPTRTGFLDVLRSMGANITIEPTGHAGGDPIGRIIAQSSPLVGGKVSGATVVRMIDEFPALMVAALCAEGTTTVRNARELRIKETDRIAVMTTELHKMGASIVELDDGFTIHGLQPLTGARVNAYDDHRVAMSLAVAGLVAKGTTIIEDTACIGDSFPGFEATLQNLGADIR